MNRTRVPADVDERFTRRATAFLSGQQAIYARLLEAMEQPEHAEAPQLLAAATAPLLRSLADQAVDLPGVVGPLRSGLSEGPRAETCRALMADVAAAAAEAYRRLETVLERLRAEQARARDEINELDRATPAAYLGGSIPALVLDRTG